LTSALVWAVPTALMGGASLLIYRALSFTPTGVSNRITDYVIAVAASPLAVGTLVCAFKGLRCLLFAIWPGRMGVWGERDALVLRLGPFGRVRYAAAKLDIRYPFELADDADEDGGYEAFLPEEEQKKRLLPRMTHRGVREPINETILRYAAGSEEEIIHGLRPAIEHWRGEDR